MQDELLHDSLEERNERLRHLLLVNLNLSQGILNLGGVEPLNLVGLRDQRELLRLLVPLNEVVGYLQLVPVARVVELNILEVQLIPPELKDLLHFLFTLI